MTWGGFDGEVILVPVKPKCTDRTEIRFNTLTYSLIYITAASFKCNRGAGPPRQCLPPRVYGKVKSRVFKFAGLNSFQCQLY